LKTKGGEEVTKSIEGHSGPVWSLSVPLKLLNILGAAVSERVEQAGHGIYCSNLYIMAKEKRPKGTAKSKCMYG